MCLCTGRSKGRDGAALGGCPPSYLEGLLSARYSEQADYDANSPANQFREAMGLNKRGKLTTQVSMFANRYPAAEALKLFGGMADAGAQAVQ